MVPVACGTSYRNKGVQKLLDAIVDYMPAPTDVPAIKGVNPETERGRSSAIRPTTEPFAALAFKIATDPFVGKLCFFRVYSGTVNAGTSVYNSTKDNTRADGPHPADARQSPPGYRDRVRGRYRRRRGPEEHHHRRHPVR